MIMIKTLFKIARENCPSIIFIDDIDILGGSCFDHDNNDSIRRAKTEFLVQMQLISDEMIFVFGATNIPWDLDRAILKRFERRIYIPLPDFNARLTLLKYNLKDSPNAMKTDELEKMADQTKGFSGSDISVFVRDAIYEPLRKMQSIKYFQEVMVDGRKKMKPLFNNDNVVEGFVVRHMNLMDVDINELLIPAVTMVR